MPDGSGFGRGPQARNVLGGALVPCSMDPLTGWYRDGCCKTDEHDHGSHTVCAVMTAEFLEFSRRVGNDLSTPRPEYHFPGLKPGDQWCLCAMRWEQARQAGVAPRVVLAATNIAALRHCALEDLQAHAAG
ncbi:DUF2237 family protein [Roseococcus thiosulfatophilus]|uniref:DUF2237 family protein n=1 Tax=Roseococcus thiosulfatophilus TaxID=35813 RepID=UPI001A8D21D3|nr:DUF2237 domain-containing protein [Roseococcus thiosulfatophilus]